MLNCGTSAPLLAIYCWQQLILIKMERVYKFKVNTFNAKFKEIWKYCKSFDDAYKHRQFGIDNGLVSSIFEFKDGMWHHV
jgi:hypothetical protein